MRTVILACMAVLTGTVVAVAQAPEGDWYAVGEVMGQPLRMNLHLQASGDSLTGTLDSPDQDLFGLPLTAAALNGDEVSLTWSQLGLTVSGSYGPDTMDLTAYQQALEIPLAFGRTPIDKPQLVRPQEPAAFPYQQEEVSFINPNGGHALHGTLTLPEGDGPFMCAILLTGSGPQDRNSEILGHKPFLVWSDYLTRAGYAVLRYDDRGVGASEGAFSPNTVQGISEDAEAAWRFAVAHPAIAADQVGFIGHSEGGLVAPMVAARVPEVAFVVSLAGPGTTGRQIISDQTGLILRAQGMPAADAAEAVADQGTLLDVLVSAVDSETQRQILTERIGAFLDELSEQELQAIGGREQVLQSRLAELTDPWYVSFVNHDPAPVWQQVQCPVFALNGSKDLQVPAESNLNGIHTALQAGGNRDVEVRMFPNMNHLFQKCTTGAPSEYGAIETTVDPAVLRAVAEWLQWL